MHCQAFLLAALIGFLTGCDRSPTPPVPPVKPASAPGIPDPGAFQATSAWAYVEGLVAIRPRDAGTPGARRAAQWIYDTLATFGYEPELDSFDDPIPAGTATFHNVIARLPGTGSGIILLISHFDTKNGIGPDFQGANDSGSSTGVLLELARRFAGNRPGPSIWFAFVDGEECRTAYGPHDGLHGSRRLARELRETDIASTVSAVIVLDMIGDRDLTVNVPANGTPYLVALAFRAATEAGIRPRFRLYDHAVLDDHVPFMEAGMPAINLIDFEYGSRPGANDYWHTMEDSLDKLSVQSLEHIGRTTIRMIQTLARP